MTSSRLEIKSSLAVFEEFFVPIELCGERIVSKECFLRWMESRGTKVKFPQDSFRRTLLAHLRGADRRKPFPPEVEANILAYLRGYGDKGSTPWSPIYAVQLDNLGFSPKVFRRCRMRTKALYGYHESRQKKPAGRSELDLSLVNREILQAFLQLDKGSLQLLENTAVEAKLDLFSPATTYLMSNLAVRDPRLCSSFVLPEKSQCHMSSDKILYQIQIKKESLLVDWSSEAFLGHERPTAGKHIGTYFQSSVELLNLLRHLPATLHKASEAWFRIRIKGKGGTCRVALCQVVRKESSDLIILQDHTDIWSQIHPLFVSGSPILQN